VKETRSETMIATATVSPKLWKNRPTRPAMKATGRKMITSESVVAMTARAISAVPPEAASMGGIPSSST
jgi:hypothetical protein